MANDLQIGSVVRKLRDEKGLTLQQLADMTSLTAAYISKIENEKVSPSIQTMKKLADALETAITDFFEEFKRPKHRDPVRHPGLFLGPGAPPLGQ